MTEKSGCLLSINIGDAASALATLYNKRYPPIGAKLLESRDFSFYEMSSNNVNYYNPWPHTRDRLENWIEDHFIEYSLLQEALYTWSVRDYNKDCITVNFYIYWQDIELRTLFDLTW